MDGLQQFRAIAVGEADVEENEVEIVLVEVLLGSRDGGGRRDVVAAVAELVFEILADDQIVLQNNDFLDRHNQEEWRR